ncbi:MAG: hypothetical protein ROO76_06455 [Terriglobia bacterium]|jgi:hypothetical protein|nr:hypothetical protein [Terriglobia bacterium]
MKKNFVVICALSTLVGVAAAQQVSSQNNVSASSNTSVSASQNGANVNSNSNAGVSSQTSATAPKHEEHSTPKHEEHSTSKQSRHHQPQPKKAQKGESTDAASALSAGTNVSALLSKPLDSRKCKPGDEVFATASEDVKANGKVVIKKGSRLFGHVTEAKTKGKGEANSSLGIVFDRALLKNGQQVQMNSVVQAIAAARTAPMPMDDDMGAMGSGGMASTGAVSGGGRSGVLGGVGSTATAATGAVANVGGNATGALNSSLGSSANVGHGVTGALTSTSSGVVGMKGMSLATAASNATEGSVITSTGKSVHLDSGTQMMLRVVK